MIKKCKFLLGTLLLKISVFIISPKYGKTLRACLRNTYIRMSVGKMSFQSRRSWPEHATFFTFICVDMAEKNYEEIQ